MHGGNLHYAVRLKPRKIPQRIWVKKKSKLNTHSEEKMAKKKPRGVINMPIFFKTGNNQFYN